MRTISPLTEAWDNNYYYFAISYKRLILYRRYYNHDSINDIRVIFGVGSFHFKLIYSM